MLISPMSTTLEDALSKEAIEEALSQLGDIDLKLLWWIVEFDKSTAKSLSKKIFLSRKATLHRARQLVEIGLVRTQSSPVAKGGIKPASFFFSTSGLTRTVIEKSMAVNLSKVQRVLSAGSDSGQTDNMGILTLGLIAFEWVNTVSGITKSLGCTKGVVRRRIKTFQYNGWVTGKETRPFKHRPGIKVMEYSLAPNLSIENVVNALANVSLHRIDMQFKLDPNISWREMGVENYEEYLASAVRAS